MCSRGGALPCPAPFSQPRTLPQGRMPVMGTMHWMSWVCWGEPRCWAPAPSHASPGAPSAVPGRWHPGACHGELPACLFQPCCAQDQAPQGLSAQPCPGAPLPSRQRAILPTPCAHSQHSASSDRSQPGSRGAPSQAPAAEAQGAERPRGTQASRPAPPGRAGWPRRARSREREAAPSRWLQPPRNQQPLNEGKAAAAPPASPARRPLMSRGATG